MNIEYDLDGCRATLVTTERTNMPSFWGLLLLAALLAVGIAAVGMFGAYGLLVVGFMGVMLLAGGGGGRRTNSFGMNQYRHSFEAEREQPAMNWVFAKRPVERDLVVKGHVLTFEAQDGERVVDLRGAEIRASSVGVYVTPELGDPLELYWDDADRADADRLADALRGIRDRQLGDQTEVPEALQRARAIHEG